MKRLTKAPRSRTDFIPATEQKPSECWIPKLILRKPSEVVRRSKLDRPKRTEAARTVNSLQTHELLRNLEQEKEL